MNYNELSQKAHAAATANGWHEQEQENNTCIALIKTELSEAFEAYRVGKYTNYKNLFILEEELNIYDGILDPNHQEQILFDFKKIVKDTFEDELADVCIRICDFCGLRKITLPKVVKIQTKPIGQFEKDFVSLDKLLTVCYGEAGRNLLGSILAAVLGSIESIAEVYAFDLEQHINLKLAYNATRGYKHGNKKL